MPRLVAIGLVAGLFSALFGVGGGILIVPLLLLVQRFSERPAMATSLAAIGVTSVAGTLGYAALGHVDFALGALIGLPAAGGAIVGAAVQQRVGRRWLTLAFAVFLAAVAVVLLV